jgi:periplasmic protein TonB
MRQVPQPGDIVATRAHDQGGADNLYGAVLIARRDEPPPSEVTDLSNVVPFARPRRQAASAAFPLSSVGADDRPAPFVAKWGIGRSIALLAGSLALHGALLAMFWRQDIRPMASIGIEVMTVEIVLGATTAAGIAPIPGEQETVQSQRADERTDDPEVTERSRVTTVMPQEVPVATVETAPDVTPQETPAEAQAVDPKLREQTETAVAEIPAAAQPTERTEQPRPQVQAVQKARDRKRIEVPTEKKASQKEQVAAAAESDGARGIGRGRSDNSANYNGRVHAHLSRYKQYPIVARRAGVQGTVGVKFSIDGSGRVTSVSLTRSAGSTLLDQEAVAMVRRASPLPAPQDGKDRDFSVSMPFYLQ